MRLSHAQVADALGIPTPPSSRSPSPGPGDAPEYDGAPCPESPPSLAVRMQHQTACYRGQYAVDNSGTIDDVQVVPLSARLRGPAAGTRLQQQMQQRGTQATANGGIATESYLLAAQAAAAARNAADAGQQQRGRRMSMETIPESPSSYHTARDGSESPGTGMQTADSGGTPMSIQSTGRFSDPSSAESANTAGMTAAAEHTPFLQARIAAGFGSQPQRVQRQQQPPKHGQDGTVLALGPAPMVDCEPAPLSQGLTAGVTFDSVHTSSESYSSSWSAHTIDQATVAFGIHGAPGMAHPSDTVAGGGGVQGSFGGFAPVGGPNCSPVGFKTYSRSLDSYVFTPGAHVRSTLNASPLGLP